MNTYAFAFTGKRLFEHLEAAARYILRQPFFCFQSGQIRVLSVLSALSGLAGYTDGRAVYGQKGGRKIRIIIPQEAFNEKYLELLHCDKRYIVLYGGAGSGKSVFAVQRFLVRMMSVKPCNLLVVRAVAATHRDSTYALFKQLVGSWGLGRLFLFQDSAMRVRCVKSGNTAVFRGLDDVEKLKSITFPSGGLTDIWIEEASEITEADFNQLDLRLRDKAGTSQIVLSFNPISALHWLKRRFFDAPPKNAAVLKTTYRDNRFLKEDYKALLEGYRETDPYYYSVYCLGQWGVLGKTVFDARKVSCRLEQTEPPLCKGEFTYRTVFSPELQRVLIDDKSIVFAQSEGGCISIYREPEPGVPYVIGGDTAGEGSDYFVGQVIDNITSEQVCVLRHRFDEDLYARQMYCLGKYYNNALIAVEVNFSGWAVRELEKLGYVNQYVRQQEDSFTRRMTERFGFKTTAVTRPLVIAELVSVARENPELLHDRETLGEMLTFVRNERGRAEAQQGAHDDCVMALGIAYFARDQQRVLPARVQWTQDMLEDYRRAGPSERERLYRKWGRP